MQSEVSQKELAAAIKRTPRQVYNLTEQGVFSRTPANKYPWPASLHAWIEYQVGLRDRESDDDQIQESERRDAAATAALKELKLARERGDVVTKTAYRQEFTRFAMIIRQVMDTFPVKHAHRIPGEVPLAEKVAALRRVSREVLEELRRGGFETGDPENADPGDAPAAEPAA